ncbi:hypothetical protein GP486_006759, partial [Trichoglossum hirsutum]
TLARSFSAALNDLFMIDSSVDTLAVSVDKKKQAVSTQSQELEALEARIRQTEELLKEKASKSPSQANGGGCNSPRRRAPLPANFDTARAEGDSASPTSPSRVRREPSGAPAVPSDSDDPRSLPKSDAQLEDVTSTMREQQDGGDFVIVDRAEVDEKLNDDQVYQRNSSDGTPHLRNRPPSPPLEH